MRIAILDLGTNTFNLLIAETVPDGKIKILLSRKEPVNLGREGINSGEISPHAFKRGILAIGSHMNYIRSYGAEQIHAFATSAIRSAANGTTFVDAVYRKFNIAVRVISGDMEACLIYMGVRQAVNMNSEKHLILDIGGGSNELIIADHRKIYWKKSFTLGMARLLERFPPSDPIGKEEILSIENYISRSLGSFTEAAMIHNPLTLIGSSGSFDTFRALHQAAFKTETGNHGNITSYKIPPEDFFRIYRSLIESTSEERLKMEGMDPMRVEMIVIAGIFINFIIRRLDIRQLIQSDFALKEGAVLETFKHRIQSYRQEPVILLT